MTAPKTPGRSARFVLLLTRPWDRCRVGSHWMMTKSGYTLCRKHGVL